MNGSDPQPSPANPTRVLFVDSVSTLAGGAQRSLLDLVRNLDRGRYAVAAALPAPGPLADALSACGVPVGFAPMRRLRKTWNPATLAAYGWSLLRAVRRLVVRIRREGIGLIHANGDIAQVYAGVAGRLAGVPVIWHARDLSGLGLLGPALYRRAAAIVAISEAVAAHVAQYGPGFAQGLRRGLGVGDAAAERIRVVYNGVEPPAPAASGARALCRAQWGIAPDAFLVGMIAQIVPWKNHGVFLEAAWRIARELPEARFAVVGDDRFGEHQALVAMLKQRAEAPELAGRVIFAGFREDVSVVLESMDLLVHPAEREPFGRAIVEAMGAGKPVVAVGRAGPAEIVRNGVNGVLVGRADAAELAEAVLGLARDPARREALAAAGRRRAAEFAPARCAAEIQRIYEETLGRR